MFWTDIAIDVLRVAFVIVSLLMCLVVLMQRSKQEGLGAAFGGGFTESMWGAQTSQVLVKATVILAALFFCISILLARLYSHREALVDTTNSKGSVVQQELLKPIAPAVTNAVPAAPVVTSATNAPVATPAANAPAAATPVPATPAAK